jgi:hypothetical protein
VLKERDLLFGEDFWLGVVGLNILSSLKIIYGFFVLNSTSLDYINIFVSKLRKC